MRCFWPEASTTPGSEALSLKVSSCLARVEKPRMSFFFASLLSLNLASFELKGVSFASETPFGGA